MTEDKPLHDPQEILIFQGFLRVVNLIKRILTYVRSCFNSLFSKLQIVLFDDA